MDTYLESNGSKNTPIREERTTSLTTPDNHHNIEDVDDLVVHFTTVKLEQNMDEDEEASIHTFDTSLLPYDVFRSTAEGTPFLSGSLKRKDFKPTPLKEDFEAHLLPLPPKTIRKPVRSNNKLLVITSASDEHNTGDHQENALRTSLLVGEQGCLRRSSLDGYIEWVDSQNLHAPDITHLLRVHEFEYLTYLDQKCKLDPISNYPDFYAPQGKLDTDTPLVSQSFAAAKKFCSAAMLAVDHIMREHYLPSNSEKSTFNRSFVIGRPPGHHAGPSGCVPSKTFWLAPGMTSSGFCLLNTVAVAAAYARSTYGNIALMNSRLNLDLNLRSTPPRIAIVDIDIHHGNGTEEIVKNLSPRMVNLPLPSSWAPVSKLSYKPWLNEKDKDEVFFGSIQLFADERFYPGSGDDASSHDNIVNIALTPIGPGPWDRPGRQRLTPAKRDDLCIKASHEFRTKVYANLLPKIKAFKPDLLFISAGFDAHYNDFYHFLTEDDIHWITNELCHVVEDCDGLGVVSVLEGGYSLESVDPPLPQAAKIRSTKRSQTTSQCATTPIDLGLDPHTMYAQQPRDGGLVKGVLAHTAALVGKQKWID